MANADIEFEALQLSEWTPEELESDVISISSNPSNDSPSRNRLMFDSPEVLGFLVTISIGIHHQPSLEALSKVILTTTRGAKVHDAFPSFP